MYFLISDYNVSTTNRNFFYCVCFFSAPVGDVTLLETARETPMKRTATWMFQISGST